jgi:ComEC/Rec2-related protein
VRAVAMFSLIEGGKLLNRKGNTLNITFGAGFFLLVFIPSYCYDLGFYLSFLAVIGIVVIHPKLSSLLSSKYKLLRLSMDAISLSVSATIATLPLILAVFHRFPVYFLPANFIMVPLSSILLFMGIGLIVLSPIQMAAIIVGKGIVILWDSMFMINDFFSTLPYSVIDQIWLPQSIIVMGSVLLVLFLFINLGFLRLSIAFSCLYLMYSFEGLFHQLKTADSLVILSNGIFQSIIHLNRAEPSAWLTGPSIEQATAHFLHSKQIKNSNIMHLDSAEWIEISIKPEQLKSPAKKLTILVAEDYFIRKKSGVKALNPDVVIVSKGSLAPEIMNELAGNSSKSIHIHQATNEGMYKTALHCENEYRILIHHARRKIGSN